MRIISFNANGLRSAASKGFFDWFALQKADVLCVQETKAQEHQLAGDAFLPAGLPGLVPRRESPRRATAAWRSTASASPTRCAPRSAGAAFDDEGRYIEARFGNLSVVSFYIPSGSSGEVRQAFKFEVMDWLRPILDDWLASGRDYVLCGDWNIVRSRMDIRNWTAQPEELRLPAARARTGSTACCCARRRRTAGSTATARCSPSGQDYTWWSQRGAARANNVGWRIDYQIVTPSLRDRLKACPIHPEPRFSDHAPFVVDYTL